MRRRRQAVLTDASTFEMRAQSPWRCIWRRRSIIAALLVGAASVSCAVTMSHEQARATHVTIQSFTSLIHAKQNIENFFKLRAASDMVSHTPAAQPDVEKAGDERQYHSRHLNLEQGWPATVEQYPYVAKIVRPDNGKYLCTGTLIHPRIVLTAAHCVVPDLDGAPNPMVLLGRDNMAQVAGIQRIPTRSWVHPKFKPGSFDFDVAALVLQSATDRKAAKLVVEGRPLGLVSTAVAAAAGGTQAASPYHAWRQVDGSSNNDVSSAMQSMQLTIIGWGATEEGGLPSQLQQGRVSPVALDACAHWFEPFASQVTNRMVCVTGRTCAGDSGGPLLAPDPDSPDGSLQLVGQVSFGFPRVKGKGCPVPNPVTAFTDLSAPRIREWLQQVIVSKKVAELDNEMGSSTSGGRNGQGNEGGVLSDIVSIMTGGADADVRSAAQSSAPGLSAEQGGGASALNSDDYTVDDIPYEDDIRIG